jgi:CheY-like chemotaxis protein
LSANRQQLMALGAKAFLLKPYTAQELLQTLSAAIATTTA